MDVQLIRAFLLAGTENDASSALDPPWMRQCRPPQPTPHPLPLSSFPSQGGMVGEHAVISTLMLSYGCMGVVTVLWALIG